MNYETEGENAARPRFFHICTDGNGNGIVFTNNEDYRQAILISAVLAIKYNVSVICYCHMSTHSHFVVVCNSHELAQAFGNEFKRCYGIYARNAYGIASVFRRVDVMVKEITDLLYLKKCIAYVLLNPVAAKICRRAEEYQWSSFDAYFDRSPMSGTNVNSMNARDIRHIFKTRIPISQSGYIIDPDGGLVIKSFVKHTLVESLFGSKADFFRSLALTNSAEEEERYTDGIVRYNDNELLSEIAGLAMAKFNKVPHLLTKSEKVTLLPALKKKTGVATGRMAKAMNMDIIEVRRYLGELTPDKP